MSRFSALFPAVLSALACSSVPHRALMSDRLTKPDDLAYAATEPPASLDHPFLEYREPGVIVVSLGANTELRSSGRSGSSSQSPLTELATDDPTEVQMALVAKAAASGPVLVLVPSAEVENTIADHCDRFPGLCEALNGPNVRFLLVKHEGLWIRDFGPMIGWRTDGKAIVLDSRYYDIRSRQTVEYKRHQINQRRLDILTIESRLENEPDGDEDDDDDGNALGALTKRAQLESLYDRLTRVNDILRDDGGYLRDLDDLAPYAIAEAIFAPDTFALHRPPLFLDGGNLIQMENGRCLTTTDLIAANGGREDLVRAALTDYYGCRQILFLQALPGPVIKHVDMFLMPIDGRRVLLSSFLPEDTTPSDISERDAYLDTLQAGGPELLVKAAMAMRDNERKLTDAGVAVVRVPGLLPRLSDRDIYYPTNLNGLIRADAKGGRQVFIPTYAGYAQKRQAAALRIIRQAFGSSADVIEIEATAAAKMQGAIHCLSMVVPVSLTYLADASSERVRADIAANLRQRARTMVQSQHLVLSGAWKVRQSKKLPIGTRVVFTEDELLISLGSLQIAHLIFDRPRVRGRDWTITLRDGPSDRSPSSATLRWLSSDSLRLIEGDDEDDAIELERVRDDQTVRIRPTD